ncbi:AAA family ATPase [Alicyclobacillus cycloheptanicus]|uniref:Stage V sporulation protein K n=1 Tax=Alicyclobacillus cycloheptanicus TaxID=1457 RepID=A0ABT9XHY6_9BACL|nr:AAA family ATPase [Alicyclobacillus cycloheptanicus]MDQ0189316.1 stage V sporulation protein K [Alicyclobacillus cycloheptanicus]WDM01324.1 AAA family ATPase [Alicyclobacillus cycloheptanicus]
MRINARRSTWGSRPNSVIAQYQDGQIALADALARLSGERPAVSPQVEPAITKERLNKLLRELDTLVGLEEVKQTVRQVFAFLYMQERRRQSQLKTEPVVLHMVFKGNPGTGKTTVARLLARLFHECGLLSKGHLVEVERADLVGEYIGHTAQKTRETIKKALGGVLFIDEAYSLARGGEKDFGREAIDCLVKGMEDYRNQFVAIIAGYEAEMEWFLATNPGLPSRFPIHMTFPDYDAAALLTIARKMAADRQYKWSPEAEFKLKRQIENLKARSWGDSHFSNARWVRNTLEEAIRLHALRLFDVHRPTREQMITLEAQDLRWEGLG